MFYNILHTYKTTINQLIFAWTLVQGAGSQETGGRRTENGNRRYRMDKWNMKKGTRSTKSVRFT